MEALYHNYQNTKYAVRFQMLADGIENNQTFYDSLVSLDIFPPYMVNMVRIGDVRENWKPLCNRLPIIIGKKIPYAKW
jgi:type II secretory pathway component PulF